MKKMSIAKKINALEELFSEFYLCQKEKNKLIEKELKLLNERIELCKKRRHK